MNSYKNRLTLIGKSTKKTPKNQYYHEYMCECGNITLALPTEIKRGSKKSCGCLREELRKTYAKGKTPSNALKDPSESGFNTLYSQYKTGANKRQLQFTLSKEQFKVLTKGDCFYCKAVPAQKRKSPYGREYYIYNGVDRKINTVGYVADNCVSCCKDCNYFKSNRDIKDFSDKIITIYNAICVGLSF